MIKAFVFTDNIVYTSGLFDGWGLSDPLTGVWDALEPLNSDQSRKSKRDSTANRTVVIMVNIYQERTKEKTLT